MPHETEPPQPCTTCKRTVILAVDGSEHSDRAVDWFFDHIYKPGHDHVYLFHAFEIPTMPTAPYPYGYGYYEEWSKLVKKADVDAIQLLEHFGLKCLQRCSVPDEPKSNLRDKHVQMYKETVKPGEGICKMAHDCHADMVVMGTRGQGTIRRTFLGSNSDHVVHHAHIPTVIVPPPHHHGDPGQQHGYQQQCEEHRT